MPPDLHPNLHALVSLLGTWQGRGSGEYPTIEPFEYLEEVTFSHVGKPFLIYGQKTKSAVDGLPLHAETGYLRLPRHNEVELVLAHPSGITEIEVGRYVADNGTVDGLPLHAETGYLRVPRRNEVELVLAHPSGITEIEVGRYVADNGTVELELTTTDVGLTPTAKDVTSLARRFRLDGDELTYSLQMGAVGQPLQHHLSAVLHRKG